MAKKKFYVVWDGLYPGIYDSWEDCKLQVTGYPQARYKSFESFEAAREAYEKGYHVGKQTLVQPSFAFRNKAASETYIRDSLAVDAACSGNPGFMEYRGVHVASGKEWFHTGPFRQGTNNIGEFLALVHGLALMKRDHISLPLYSDSLNAMQWVRLKKCRTKLERTEINAPVFNLIERAEKWLQENTFTTQILKWNTEAWGEIPADFNRK
jgi:ribonuclease HI